MIDGELLAVIASRAGAPAACLDLLAGPLGAAARVAFAELVAAEPAQRTRRIAHVLAAVGNPVPASVRRAHPEWVEAAVAAEPEAAAILAEPSQQPAAVWIARRAFVSFGHQTVAAHEVDSVKEWLSQRGALALAIVVRDRRAALAAAMAQLAASDGDAALLLAHVARRLERAEIEAPPRRAAVAACAGVELRQAEALLLIGVAMSARELQEEPARWRLLALHLPRAVGYAIAAIVG